MKRVIMTGIDSWVFFYWLE